MIAVCVIILTAAGGLYLGWVNGPVVLGCIALSALAAYLLGCSNGAVLVSKYVLRDDVRTHGSGNAGLTNFHRTFGGPLTLLVILSDVLKMVLAAYLSVWMWRVIGADSPVLAGKLAPAHRDPRDTYLVRAVRMMNPPHTTRAIRQSSSRARAPPERMPLPPLKRNMQGNMWPTRHHTPAYVYRDTRALLPLATACGILVVWGHRANIVRLLEGTENKFSLHKKRE